MAKSRRVSRKVRRASKRKGSRRMRGGQAPVGDNSMAGPMNLSLAQGKQFAEMHAAQHGGVAPYPGAVQGTPFLSGAELESAKQAGLMAKYAEIAGMKDQAGGKRRKSRKASRKSRKAQRKAHRKAHRKDSRKASSRKASSRKASRRTRRQRGGLVRWGGGAYGDTAMPVAESTKMLIPDALRQQAGLNPEWKLAENPMAFAPRT